MDSIKETFARPSGQSMKICFSDFFAVDPVVLDAHGAFNVSLINDVPVFIDPFLLFNSGKPDHRALHDEITRYIRFLRGVSNVGDVNKGHKRREVQAGDDWRGEEQAECRSDKDQCNVLV
jgi:hypothetical protein